MRDKKMYNDLISLLKYFLIKKTEVMKIFLLPIIILTLHFFFSAANIYQTYDWADVLMHFFGGASIGISYTLLALLLRKDGHLGNLNGLFLLLFVISLIGTTAVVWEFSEFAEDTLFKTLSQPSVADTMQDLFLGLMGGSISGLLTYKLKSK